MITDHLWKPAVEVSRWESAFMVHPGSRLAAEQLEAGWRWHWPVISIIRTISKKPWKVSFTNSGNSEASNQLIEPIVCITRDHHLWVVEGSIELTFDGAVESPKLSELSAKAFRRQAQSWLRQALRAVIAEYQSRQLENPSYIKLQQQLCRELGHTLQPWSIDCSRCQVFSVKPYRLQLREEA